MKGSWIRSGMWAMALLLCVPILPSAEAGLFRREKPDELLRMGKAALEDGLPKLAEKKFNTYLKVVEDPQQRAEGVLYLARAKYGQGEYEDVIDLLNKRSRWAAEAGLVGGFAYWKTRAQVQLGQYEEALKVLSVFEEAFPDDTYEPYALRLRSRAYLALGQNEAALKDFSRFDFRYPDMEESAENLLDWALTLLKLQEVDKGKSLLAQLIERYTDSPSAVQARLHLSKLLIDGHEWAKADTLLQAVAIDDRARAEWKAASLFALAEVSERQTNLQAAIEYTARGRDYAVDALDKAQADVAIGRLMILMGDHKQGIDMIKKTIRSIAKEPRAAEYQLMMAQLLLDEGHPRRATEAFQHYLDAFSDKAGRAKALYGKGWALWQRGRYAEAAEAFEKAYAAHAAGVEKERALLKAADAYFENKQFQLARQKYLVFSESHADSALLPQAQFQAAECLARLGMLEEAEKDFESIYLSYTNTSFAEQSAMRIGLIKEEQGAWDEAIRTYERVMTEFTDGLFFARALHGRGLVRYRLGYFDEALEDFTRVVEAYGGQDFAEQARFMRGWCLYLLGEEEEALRLSQEFIQQRPDSPWAPHVLFWLGEFYFNGGDYGLAEKYWRDLADTYPGQKLADKALYWAGQSAYRQKEYLRAIECFNALTKQYPGSSLLAETRFAQGDASTQLGHFDVAILAFEEIMKNYPDTELATSAKGRIGDCQFMLGSEDPERYKEALFSFREVLEFQRASPELKMQAEYKMGRCYEKMGDREAAFERYMNVVYSYFLEREKGLPVRWLWFTRAAFNAASMKEGDQAWLEAVRIYERVIDAGVPAAADARKRRDSILEEHELVESLDEQA